MFRPTLTTPRSPEPRAPHLHREDQGTTWRGSRPKLHAQHVADRVNGCIVVRRITDDRGRDWRVRQLWSEHCHGLLFQCSVRGVRSEIRPMRGPLEALTDDELLIALAPVDD